MCGFAGYLSESINADKDIIYKMVERVSSRGPDSEGLWLDQTNNFAIGHKRLSILDLSNTGHQPIISSNSRYVLAFNGEIYNHLEIRRLLNRKQDISWKGTSDTETLINAIEKIGLQDTLKLINGMFSFALWDRNEGILKLVRDRLGEKPLYYGLINDNFVFGSQLKCFIDFPNWDKRLDQESISLYFKYGYIPAPKSIFNKIFKLEAGNVLIIKKNNFKDFKKYTYWDLRKILNKKPEINYSISNDQYLEEVERKLKKSIERRMLSDVPIGAFLSGGIDSSCVVTYMKEFSKEPLKTFTVGFKDKNYNESKKAKRIAGFLGTDHNEIIFDKKELVELFDELGDVWDEPFSDISQVPTLLVSKVAKKQVKVVLSGDGGDELFCGYNRYIRGLDFYQLSKNKFSNLIIQNIKKYKDYYERFLNFKDNEKLDKMLEAFKANCIDEYYDNVVEIFKQNDKLLNKINFERNYINPLSKSLDYLCDEEKLMYIDLIRYIPEDIMTKVDRASMSIGLEARAPFLDHELVEYSFQIPIYLKKSHGKGKLILKDLLSNYLPNNLIDNSKEGFSVPIHDLIEGSLSDLFIELINNEINNKESLFDKKRLKEIFHKDNKEIKLEQKKWTTLMFLLWKDKFFNK